MQLVTIPIDEIEVPPRLREIDQGRAQELAVSMREAGLIQPIVVMPPTNGRYLLNVGAHRLTAARLLGWQDIQALVIDGSVDEVRLREIDENLYRRELSPFDQAAFLAERRDIYERIFGTVQRGGKRSKGKSAQSSFFDDVTARFGLQRRDVTRALARIRGIDPAAWKALRGTKFAEKGVILDGLARLDPVVQRQVVDLLLGKEARSVAGAIALLHGTDARIEAEKEFAALQTKWRQAGKAARARFLTFLKSDAA